MTQTTNLSAPKAGIDERLTTITANYQRVFVAAVALAISLVGQLIADEGDRVFDVPKRDGIVIDGIADDWKDAGFKIDVLTSLDGWDRPVSNLDSRVSIGWDGRGLLVLIQVSDQSFVETNSIDALFASDSVELFLVDKRGGTQMMQAVIAPGMTREQTELRYTLYDYRTDAGLKTNSLTLNAARTKTPRGYVMEVLLPWSNIWVVPILGAEVAFQVFVNDKDVGERLFNTVWYPATGTFRNSGNTYRLRLADRAGQRFASKARGFARFGETWFSVIAASDLAGKSVEVRFEGKLIGSGKLAAIDGRAMACVRAKMPDGLRETSLFEVGVEGQATNVVGLLSIGTAGDGEALARLLEIDRVQAGPTPHDPAASRSVVPVVTQFAAQLFMSPDGNDKNSGTRTAPVANLLRARDLVREIRGRGERGAIAVNVLAGEYPLTASVELSAEDSGTEQGPVVYRAVQPGQSVFYGGRRISGFKPVADPAILARLPQEARDKVQGCDLRALGITNYSRLAVRGFSQPPAPPTVELFVNGKPMTLARWPNTGFVGIRRLVAPGEIKAGIPSVFEYEDDRHLRWTKARDPWLFGYFNRLWADGTLAISRIDPETRTVVCNEAYHAGWTPNHEGMNTHEGIQYYAFNLLEEIDLPGEWYLDREAGILYLYPPVDLAGATVEIGMLLTPMMTMTHVTDIRLEGLTFDLGRYDGLALNQCCRVLIAGCTVSRMAGDGIVIQGGDTVGILSCDIHTIGRRASEVSGGDRETLKPGRHFVENCRIHDFGRIDRTYTPAVALGGVGNRVAHNLMYDCPTSVIGLGGNDHIIEFNDVRNAVRESDDQGGLDMFGNPTFRGLVFRYNRFTDIGRAGAGEMANGQAAIRTDDAISGVLIYGNVFVRASRGRFGAVQMNAGRDNIVANNLFIDCTRGISGGWSSINWCWQAIRDNKHDPGIMTSALYLSRYPAIATMMTAPGKNFIWRNVFFRSGGAEDLINMDLAENADYGSRDPGFADAAHADWRLKPTAKPYADIGFRPIPMDAIGLYQDAYR
ncbi:MAG: sugar-binding protein, partial [Kiritimatiellia bacterium]